MSIWAKIAKYGGSALKGAGSVAKQGLKSASNTAVHPTQALKGAGSAMKTAAVGSAAGYVAWQNRSCGRRERTEEQGWRSCGCCEWCHGRHQQ